MSNLYLLLHPFRPPSVQYAALECLQAEDMAREVEHIMAAPKHVQIHDILVRPTEQKF